MTDSSERSTSRPYLALQRLCTLMSEREPEVFRRLCESLVQDLGYQFSWIAGSFDGSSTLACSRRDCTGCPFENDASLAEGPPRLIDPSLLAGCVASEPPPAALAVVPASAGGSRATLLLGSPHREELTGRSLEALSLLAYGLIPAGEGIEFRRKRELATRQLDHVRREREAIFDAIPAMVFYKDLQNNLARVNRYFAEVTGLPREEIEGRNATEIAADPDVAEQYWLDDLEVIRTGVPKLNIIEPLISDETKTRWYRTDKVPYIDENGEIAGVIGFGIDITEQMRAKEALSEANAELEARVEERTRRLTQTVAELEAEIARRLRTEDALRRTERRLSDVVAHTGQWIFETDVLGRLTYCSTGAYEVTGYLPTELIGTDLGELLPPDEGGGWTGIGQRYGRAIFRGMEDTLIRRDGSLCLIEISASPLEDETGYVLGYRGVIRDVTEKKEMERREREAKRVESLGVMAAGVAHDLNNLLTVILGNAEFGLEVTDIEEAKAAFQDIFDASHRAAEVGRKMLAYTGRGSLEKVDVDLAQVIAEAARAHGSRDGTTLLVDAPDQAVTVAADRAQITQALGQLVANAVEAGSSTIRLRAEVRSFDAEPLRDDFLDVELPAGAYAVLECGDDGHGIPDEHRAQVFDPFYGTRFLGRGLGLSVVLGIARAHMGTVRLESTPGVGTLVQILLPTVASATVAPPAREAVDADPGRRCLLVVDDERGVLSVCGRAAEALGYCVLTASGGEEALAVLAGDACAVSAVILDYTMPGMNGAEVYERLRQTKPDLPVILSSGYAKDDDAIRALMARGLAGFLPKPYTQSDLADVLRHILPKR